MNSVMTLAVAQANLLAWMNASAALAEGKQVQINGRMLTLENGNEVRQQIVFWQSMESQLLNAAASNTNRGGASLARFS